MHYQFCCTVYVLYVRFYKCQKYVDKGYTFYIIAKSYIRIHSIIYILYICIAIDIELECSIMHFFFFLYNLVCYKAALDPVLQCIPGNFPHCSTSRITHLKKQIRFNWSPCLPWIVNKFNHYFIISYLLTICKSYYCNKPGRVGHHPSSLPE